MRERSFVEVLICAHRQRMPCNSTYNSWAWQPARKFFICAQHGSAKLSNEFAICLFQATPSIRFQYKISVDFAFQVFIYEDWIRVWIACSFILSLLQVRLNVSEMLVFQEIKKIPRNFISIRDVSWCSRARSTNMSHAFVTNYSQKESQVFHRMRKETMCTERNKKKFLNIENEQTNQKEGGEKHPTRRKREDGLWEELHKSYALLFENIVQICPFDN